MIKWVVGRFLGNPLAIVAKTAEVLLIIATFLHLRMVQRANAAVPVPATAGQGS